MEGGSGNDTYVVDNRYDQVVENENAGVDTVQVSGLSTYTLAANVENLLVIGNRNFHGVGNTLDNRIIGGNGRDWLDGGAGNDDIRGGNGNDELTGGAGADRLSGGDGVDRVSYATSQQGVSIDLAAKTASGGDAAGDTLSGIENVTGSDAGDILVGNAQANDLSGGLGNDTISGGGGNDVIDGGAGADSMDGGTGRDTLSYAGSTIGVIVNLAQNLASGGDAQGDSIVNFENVLGGNGNDVLTGDDGTNVLSGGAGNDTIAGGDGIDVISGGAGADALDGGLFVDTVSYAGSAGAVSVDLATQLVSGGDAEGDTITGFENALGGDGSDSLHGSGGANALSGGDGADSIDGGGGDDDIKGGAGADSMIGGGGTDTLSYAGSSAGGVTVDLASQTAFGGDASGDIVSGFENVSGSTLSDWLYGDNTANFLSGSGGSDWLDGRGGNDRLVGGANDDVFVYGLNYGHDIIADFRSGLASNEVIQLNLGPDFDTFAEVMSVSHAAGATNQSTVFDFGPGASLQLSNVKSGTLVESDFQFT
jgi:Ca2+-binding RTX toxin-like protein